MKYKCETKVTKELLDSGKINDEYLFKDLARKIVSEMTLESLKELFKLDKIDPNSEKSKYILINSADEFEVNRILQLRDCGLILYEAKSYNILDIALGFSEWIDINGIRDGRNEWKYKLDNYKSKFTTQEMFHEWRNLTI
ncbi:hypothetical protein Phi10:1_gp104 [Cellulophaga phage phi10:1]|uniref:Uncharacterized protein n=1 Tax=Cellulophaga phage phi10:1 TaxID=1327981 RepID=R9ZYL5_9CAUD|nr:hypothetical protein Phi10:1_gp104 [Cellulophaga phage phi10:1]AGO48444.1 hypothetical protein Phi10:1_gp104 [Cellulophaga phage phi10:1]